MVAAGEGLHTAAIHLGGGLVDDGVRNEFRMLPKAIQVPLQDGPQVNYHDEPPLQDNEVMTGTCRVKLNPKGALRGLVGRNKSGSWSTNGSRCTPRRSATTLAMSTTQVVATY